MELPLPTPNQEIHKININVENFDLKNKNVKTKKPKSKRVVVQDIKKWNFLETELDVYFQKKIIQYLYFINTDNDDNTLVNPLSPSKIRFVIQQINQKINGYHYQDLLKNKYDKECFIDYSTIIEKLHACDLQCYYCKENMQILYEFVREPKQWSVERIQNEFGHNKNNVEIACLKCNLNRKTIQCTKYIQTKNMSIVKKLI